MVRVVVVVVALVSGCLRSDSVECKNGITCPTGTLCDDANRGCVVREQFDACANGSAGDACTWPDGAGECVNGVCLGHVCNDGRRSGPERCDPSDPNANMTTCTSVELGYYQGGEVSCAADCTWNTSPCSEYCGDGVLNGNEQCEQGIAPIDTCVDYGFDRGALGCGACAPTFGDCGLIGWRRRVMPASPSQFSVVGSDVFVAMQQSASPDLAARFVGGAWVGLGTDVHEGAPAAQTIAATSTTNVWVGGAANSTSTDLGFVSRYDGTAWTRVRTFPGVVTAMWAAGTFVFVIAGSELYIYDGATWTSQTLAASSIGFWISGSSSSDVWIGGTKLWHGGAAQSFTEVTLPVTGTVQGVSAFGPDQVAVAVYEPTPNRLGLQVRENGTWRAVPYTATGLKQGQPFARAGNNIYLLVTDINTSVVAHHDGTSWAALTDTSILATTLAGSDKVIVAGDRNSDTSYHYSGSVWMPRSTPSMPVGQLWGPRADEVYAPQNTQFTTCEVFNGTIWQGTTVHGNGDVSGGVMYSLEPNNSGNPRLWRKALPTLWASSNLPNATATDVYAPYLGVLGMNDLFLQQYVSGVQKYFHWAGNVTDDAPLETTNLPDGEMLTQIDCRAGAGCYAGGATLWHTPGDRNAWTKLADAGVGTITSIWIADATFIALGGAQGRIAYGNGTTWTLQQLPTSAPIVAIVGNSATDAFALAHSFADEHQLFHWNGARWSRVRSPLPSVGSNVALIWTGGRITYFGSNATIYALIRTERW